MAHHRNKHAVTSWQQPTSKWTWVANDTGHVVGDKQLANGGAASYVKTKGLVAKMRRREQFQSIYELSYYESGQGMIDVESMTVTKTWRITVG